MLLICIVVSLVYNKVLILPDVMESNIGYRRYVFHALHTPLYKNVCLHWWLADWGPQSSKEPRRTLRGPKRVSREQQEVEIPVRFVLLTFITVVFRQRMFVITYFYPSRVSLHSIFDAKELWREETVVITLMALFGTFSYALALWRKLV